MSEINDLANEIKKKMGQQPPVKPVVKEQPKPTPVVAEVKPASVPTPKPPPMVTQPPVKEKEPVKQTVKQQTSLEEIPFPSFANQNIKVEKPIIESDGIDIENLPPEEKKKFDQMIDDTNSYQLLILSILLAYVGVHGTSEERDDLLRCISMVYKFDGYKKYMDKVVAMMMKYKEEDVSVFNIFDEIPTINQDLVNAEVEKRRQEIDNLNNFNKGEQNV